MVNTTQGYHVYRNSTASGNKVTLAAANSFAVIEGTLYVKAGSDLLAAYAPGEWRRIEKIGETQ